MRRAAGLLAASLLAATPAAADTKFLRFDAGHTHIMFGATHLGLSTTYGEFEAFEGRVVLDTDRPENVVVEVTVDVTSLDSGLPARDENLLGGSWFDAAAHPQMTFTATGFEQTGDTTGILTGDLALRGVTGPVRLDVTFNGTARDPFSSRNIRWGFSARGTLSRSAFGMDFGTDFVGDEVTLMIETELLETPDDR